MSESKVIRGLKMDEVEIGDEEREGRERRQTRLRLKPWNVSAFPKRRIPYYASNQLLEQRDDPYELNKNKQVKYFYVQRLNFCS